MRFPPILAFALFFAAPLIFASPLVLTPEVDLGDLFEDQGQVITLSPLKNEAKAPIQILSAEGTCGCTVVEMEKKRIEPGEEIGLKISIDLTGKIGPLAKKITVETDQGSYTITINGTVHKRVGDHGTGFLQKKIFNAPCSACHSKDEGKSGQELFNAVCAFCHGHNGGGATAPSLNRLDFLIGKTDNDIVSIISHGRVEKGMPAFLTNEGGPLTSEQIQSLIPFARRDQPLLERLKQKKNAP